MTFLCLYGMVTMKMKTAQEVIAMLNFLKEYQSIETKKDFISAVGSCLYPFAKVKATLEDVVTGEEAVKAIEQSNPIGWGRVPDVIRRLIEVSPFVLSQVLDKEVLQVVWFVAETVKGFYVIRYYTFIPPGYEVNSQGTVCNSEKRKALLEQIRETPSSDPNIDNLIGDLQEMEKGEQFSTAEAAEILGIENGWLHTYYKNGVLEFTKTGEKEKSPRQVSRLFLNEFIQKSQWDVLEKAQPTKVAKQFDKTIFNRPKRSGPYGRSKIR